MRNLLVGLVVLVLLAAVLPIAAQDEATAYLRVGHFSPGAGDVALVIDGELSDIQPLAFARLSDWVVMPPGDYQLTIIPSGAGMDEALISADLTLEADQWVTEVIIGEVPRGTMALYPLVEDYSDIAFGETRITFFHAIPDLNAINIQLDSDILLVDTLNYPTLDDDAAEEADGHATLDIIAGVRTLEVVSALDGETVLLTMPDIEFANGKNHLVVVAGLRANAIVTWVATATDAVTMATETASEDVNVGTGGTLVRLAYFVPDGVEAVDLYIDGVLSDVEALAYGTASDWFEVPAGFYDLAVAPAGTSLDEAFIRAQDVPVVTDEPATLVALGSFVIDTALIQPVVENVAPVAEGETRLAVLHTVHDMPLISVQLTDGTPLLAAVGYLGLSEVSGYGSVDLRAGLRDLQIVATLDTTTLLVDLPDTQLPAGTNNLLVVAGSRRNPAVFQLVAAQE